MNTHPHSRRAFLGTAAFAAAAFTTGGAFAEELGRTPSQTEGPFYPDKLPLDTDNDLLLVNDAITPAVGEVTHLSGRILDAKGDPRNDRDGVYRGIPASARGLVCAEYVPVPGSRIGELAAKYDVIVGYTPKA